MMAFSNSFNAIRIFFGTELIIFWISCTIHHHIASLKLSTFKCVSSYLAKKPFFSSHQISRFIL